MISVCARAGTARRDEETARARAINQRFFMGVPPVGSSHVPVYAKAGDFILDWSDGLRKTFHKCCEGKEASPAATSDRNRFGRKERPQTRTRQCARDCSSI